MTVTSTRSHGSFQAKSSCTSERRRKLRFPMRCSIFLRVPAVSDRWILSETSNVSAVGAYFPTKVELLRDESVEYVLTFPPELTHATSPWRVRFYGNVVRVEPETRVQRGFGIAVYTTKRRYLLHEESARFSSLDGRVASSETGNAT
jgi:hypothetical protein